MEPASAAIGLITFGAQIGTTAWQLKKLWDQVKQVPHELRELLDSLEHVSLLLDEAERTSLPTDVNIKRGLQRCAATLNLLDDMARSLDAKLQRKRNGGAREKLVALRSLMTKDDFETHKGHLETALSTLRLALELSNRTTSQQILEAAHSEAESRVEHEAARREFEKQQMTSMAMITSGQSANSEALQQILEVLRANFPDQNADTRVNNGSLSMSVSVVQENRKIPTTSAKPRVPMTRKEDEDTETSDWSIGFRAEEPLLSYTRTGGSWSVRLRVPTWRSTVIYSLDAITPLSTYVFRTYNDVSPDSEIAQSIRQGNIGRVRELFQSKKASPFDMVDMIMPLLIFAGTTRKGDCEIWDLLLDQYRACGIELSAVQWTMLATTLLFDPLDGQRPEHESRENLRRIIHIGSGYSGSDDASLTQTLALMYFFAPGIEAFRMDVIRQEVFADYSQHPLETRINYARLAALGTGRWAPAVMDASMASFLLLRGPCATIEALRESTSTDASLLHSAAYGLGVSMRRRNLIGLKLAHGQQKDPEVTSQWTTWAQDLARVATVRDLHVLEDVETLPHMHQLTRGTPLNSVLGGLTSRRPTCSVTTSLVDIVTRQWLMALRVGGVDLLEYGAYEAAMFKGADVWKKPDSTEGDERHWCQVRVISLVCGPVPDDWKIYWATEYESFALDFWMLIHKPETVMPGAWVDD